MGIGQIAGRISLGWDVYQFLVWLVGTTGTTGGAIMIWRELQSAPLFAQILLGICAAAAWALLVTAMGTRVRSLLSRQPVETAPAPPGPRITSVNQSGGQTGVNILNFGKSAADLVPIAMHISNLLNSGRALFEEGRTVSAQAAPAWLGRVGEWRQNATADVQRLLGAPAVAILRDSSGMFAISFRSDLGAEFNNQMQILDRVLGNLSKLLPMLHA